MKPKNKKTLKIHQILAGLVVLTAAVVSGLWYMHRDQPAPAQSTIVEQKQNAPVQSVKQAEDGNQKAQDVPVSATTSLDGLVATQANGLVRATATVANTKGDGTCVFTFENPEDKPVVRQSKIIAKDTTCDSGNIPEQEFSFLGTWKLTLRYYTSDNTQAVATTEINIK